MKERKLIAATATIETNIVKMTTITHQCHKFFKQKLHKLCHNVWEVADD
jgi:hypothetical protein